MKKTIVVLTATVVASVASAGLVWENDFNSPNTFFDPAPNPVDIHDGRDEAWLGAGTATTNASQQLVVKSGGSGQTRGLVRVLNPLNHAAQVDTTGDDSFYRFTFDIINVNADTTFNVQVLQGTRDAGLTPANTYNIDLLSATQGELTHTVTGSGTLTSLADVGFVQADNGTTATIDFEYDGTGDIVLVFDATANSASAWTRWTTTDNMSLNVIPEPATLGLVGTFGAAILFLRRKFFI